MKLYTHEDNILVVALMRWRFTGDDVSSIMSFWTVVMSSKEVKRMAFYRQKHAYQLLILAGTYSFLEMLVSNLRNI